MWLSLVRPSGCSHVKVSWVDGLDSFGGDVVTEEVAVGRMGEAVDALGLLLGIGPALTGLVKVVKGPMTGSEAALKGEANAG